MEWRQKCPTRENVTVGSKVTALAYVLDEIENNSRASLLKELSHIHFPNLIYLGIWRNQIESLEGIIRVDMPNMEDLQLGKSSIKQTETASLQWEC